MTMASGSNWFETLAPPRGSSLKLFCFPYAGGSSQMFRGWQRYLSPDVRLCLVHLPGRGVRISDRPFTRLAAMVEALAQAILPELEGAFAFWGHSMGAMINFELARELRRRRLTGPDALFVSGRTAPQIPITNPPTFDLPEEEFVAELHRLNGTPRELLDNPETRHLFLPTIRADFEAVETYHYVPEGPLSCPIYAYGGLQDSDVSPEDLRAWQEQTSARCKARMFPGDHFFIHNPAAGFVYSLREDVRELMYQVPEDFSTAQRGKR
jgi:medium-chain acyl-[acyl-carrier-protein] hydrolase